MRSELEPLGNDIVHSIDDVEDDEVLGIHVLNNEIYFVSPYVHSNVVMF